MYKYWLSKGINIFDITLFIAPSWPLTNRDLALEASITTNPVTCKRTVQAKPLLNVISEKKDLVRIKNYW